METSKPTPYTVKKLRIESVTASGELRPAPIDLNELIASFSYRENTISSAEYRPESYPAVVLRIRRPQSTVSVFYSGRFNINTKSDETEKAVRRFKTVLKSHLNREFEVSYKINNVVGSGVLNQEIDCGVLGTLFPSSKKAFGEGHRIYVGDSKANFVYYPSGKIIGTGFASSEEIKTKLDNQIELINKNLDSLEKTRKEVCFTERTVPAIRSYYDLIKKAKSEYNIGFTDEERLKGRQYLERFLDNASKQKGNLRGNPGTFGAATIYLLAESNPSINKLGNKRLTENDVAYLAGLSDATVRNAKKRMIESIENI